MEDECPMTLKREFWSSIKSMTNMIPKGICTCCGHKLGNHIDETEGWRCHSLGQDFYQCECFLRKGRYKSLMGYDLKKRVTRYQKEERRAKEGVKIL